jgi:hypothetical protein
MMNRTVHNGNKASQYHRLTKKERAPEVGVLVGDTLGCLGGLRVVESGLQICTGTWWTLDDDGW